MTLNVKIARESYQNLIVKKYLEKKKQRNR